MYMRKLKTNLLLALIIGAICFVTLSSSTAFADDENIIDPQQLPDSSFIYDTSIIDLSTADSYYDNQTVQVIGEAVGDRIKVSGSSEYVWITLAAEDASTNASVTVFMKAIDAEKIDTFGKYGTTGTTLRVRGTYHLTCSDHEGLSDIHAEFVSVQAKGEHHPDTFDPQAFIPGAVTIGIGVLMLLVYYYMRERRR